MAIMTGKKNKDRNVKKKGRQGRKKDDWRKKRGTEGEMRPIKRAMRGEGVKGTYEA